MFRTLRLHVTYANVVSTLCLFMLLGGSAYAASLVTGKNVKDSSLTTKDVKDRSLLSRDFKPGQIPTGAAGPAGPQGDRGERGEKGEKGEKGDPGPLITPENVDNVGDADGPAFVTDTNASGTSCPTNGTSAWQNYGGGFAPAGFYRDPFGRVYLRGLVKKTAGNIECAIFRLPAGYRPAEHAAFSSVADNKFVRVSVYSDGEVDPEAVPTGGGNFLSLEGISFRCGPSGNSGCP